MDVENKNLVRTDRPNFLKIAKEVRGLPPSAAQRLKKNSSPDKLEAEVLVSIHTRKNELVINTSS